MDLNKLNKLTKLIADTLGTNQNMLDSKTEFLADLNASPEEISQLLQQVESKFDLEFDSGQGKNISTIADLIQLIEETEL